jgi:hypothetical protein
MTIMLDIAKEVPINATDHRGRLLFDLDLNSQGRLTKPYLTINIPVNFTTYDGKIHDSHSGALIVDFENVLDEALKSFSERELIEELISIYKVLNIYAEKYKKAILE